MAGPSSPCRDCPDRTVEPNCHDPERCPKWAEYAAYWETVRAARQEYAKTWAYESGCERAITMKLKGRQRRSAQSNRRR